VADWVGSLLAAVWWGGLAASALLIGYVLANQRLSNRTIGMVMGLGAGALISAIAYEQVPESAFGGVGMAVAFVLGALVFFGGDWLIDRRGGHVRKDISGDQSGGSGAAIFLGTLLDNVPESIILGMSLAGGSVVNIAFLSAVFISNLPEGVAGTINLVAAGYSHHKVLIMWSVLVLGSAACAGLGYAVTEWLPNIDRGYIQAFAAGAMLTMLADAMMPEAFEHGGKAVGLFSVLGFLLAGLLSVMQ
jgi:ZIP family zinc transporter